MSDYGVGEVAIYPLSPLLTDFSTALEASSVISASACFLRKIEGRIDSTAAGVYANLYLQLLSASSLPADGAVTFLRAPLKIRLESGKNTHFNIDFTYEGIAAPNGAVWCLSTTEFTKTIAGAYGSATVYYRL